MAIPGAVPEEGAKTHDRAVLSQVRHPETGCPGGSGRIRGRNIGRDMKTGGANAPPVLLCKYN